MTMETLIVRLVKAVNQQSKDDSDTGGELKAKIYDHKGLAYLAKKKTGWTQYEK